MFFPFNTNGRHCDFECPIHRIINSGQIEGANFGRVISVCFTKNVISWLFLKFSSFERWITTCFIIAIFRFFTILCFLKNRHNPCWSVRTLDQNSFRYILLTRRSGEFCTVLTELWTFAMFGIFYQVIYIILCRLPDRKYQTLQMFITPSNILLLKSTITHIID